MVVPWQMTRREHTLLVILKRVVNWKRLKINKKCERTLYARPLRRGRPLRLTFRAKEGGDDMADDEEGLGPPRHVHVVLRM